MSRQDAKVDLLILKEVARKRPDLVEIRGDVATEMEVSIAGASVGNLGVALRKLAPVIQQLGIGITQADIETANKTIILDGSEKLNKQVAASLMDMVDTPAAKELGEAAVKAARKRGQV